MLFSLVIFLSVCALCADSFSLGKAGQNECGKEASSHLVHHNPWLVFVEYFQNGHLTHVRCGGTLIDSRHVVTAAHCVRKPKFHSLKARLGEYDLESKLECVEGICTERVVEIDVEDILVHPGYDDKEHDIAVLRLKKDAPYTDFIRPICLPSGKLTPTTTFVSAGWGIIPRKGEFSHIKKIIPLPFVNFDTCQNVYKNTPLPKHVICAGGVENIDTCSGDSGGPLVWVKDRSELWGVVSSGNVNCGTKGDPGIYTSVIDHLDWLKSVVKNDKSKFL